MNLVQKKEHKFITWEDVLPISNGGIDIFKYEIGSFPLNKPFNSPLRKDKNPSFSIKIKDDVARYLDFSTGDSGDALDFVQRKYNYDLKKAMKHIIATLGLENKSIVNIKKQTNNDSKEIHIAFTEAKYDSRHSAYWNSYHISTDFLKRNNVFRVKDLAINHKRIILKPEELTYAYYAEDIDKCKILRIGVGKEDKWRNNVPASYLWFSKGLYRCNNLLVCKSVKDALVSKMLGICSVAVQSENAKIFDSNNEKLSSISKNIYVAFGTDAQGKEQSNLVTDKYGYKHYNTPDKYLEFGCNDIAELAKYDLNVLISHLKSKKIL